MGTDHTAGIAHAPLYQGMNWEGGCGIFLVCVQELVHHMMLVLELFF